MSTRPGLFIFTGSTGVTGGLIAAIREARAIADMADVTVIIPDSADVDEGQWSDVRFLRLPFAHPRPTLASLSTYPLRLLRSGIALRRALRRADCQRLQVNDFTFMEGAVVRALGFKGKIVTWVRIDPRRFGAVGRIWLAAARRTSDRIVAVSRHIGRLLPKAWDSQLLYDPAVLVESMTTRPAGPTQTFLFPANFTPGKGQDVAIAAMAQVTGEYPEARLALVGGALSLAKNQQYREQLETRARDLHLQSRVSFADFMPDLGPAYRAAFAVLNLSESESFSLVCQEAATHGLPVIATRSGGPTEIIDDGRSGFLVEVGDVEAVADRMRRLLSDPDAAAAMGDQGKKLVTQWFGIEGFRTDLAAVFDLSPPSPRE